MKDMLWSGTTVIKSEGKHFRPRISLFEPGKRYVWSEQNPNPYSFRYERFHWWNFHHLQLFFGGKKLR